MQAKTIPSQRKTSCSSPCARTTRRGARPLLRRNAPSGPTFGSICPATAADTPREKIVMLKAAAVWLKVQPESLTSIVWKKLHA